MNQQKTTQKIELREGEREIEREREREREIEGERERGRNMKVKENGSEKVRDGLESRIE